MTRNPTEWSPEDSGTVTNDNEDEVRVTEDGETRVTEDSISRVIEDSVVTPKNPTVWSGGE